MQHDELAEIAKEKFLAGLQDALTKKQFPKVIEILKLAHDKPLGRLITPPVIGQIMAAVTESRTIDTARDLKTILEMVEDDPTWLSEMVPGMVTILAKNFIEYADIPGFIKLAKIAEARHDWRLSFGQVEVVDAFLNAHQVGRIDGSATLTELQNTAPRVAEAFAASIESRQAEIDARKAREASIRATRNVEDDKKEEGKGGQGFNGGHARRGSRGPGFGPGLG